MRTGSMLFALAVVGLVSAPASGQQPGVVSLTSLDLDEAAPNAASKAPSVSGDGRFIAFESAATDLVPGDTNENSDVFLRDQLAGTTQRVSVTWKGQEARGDSACPAISADGTRIAFLSNAWNMYAGGANLGAPRWDVYVHDRLTGSTTRVQIAEDGGVADGDAVCPVSISADGSRVAFTSFARNLVAPEDDPLPRYPAHFAYVWHGETGEIELVSRYAETGAIGTGTDTTISGDGRFVAFASRAKLVADARPNESSLIYVLDLETSVLEREGQNHPIAGASSYAPSLSHDGRYLAFLSRDRKYQGSGEEWVLPQGRKANVIVGDRWSDSWLVATDVRDSIRCLAPDDERACRAYHAGPPSMSGDGRFVTFSTRTGNHLPGTYGRGIQVFVYDRETRRLRRVSVSAEGTTGDRCSVEPSISADGESIAYRTSATNLVPGSLPHDVVVHTDWQCDVAGGCRTPSRCPPTPLSCERATRSRLRLRRSPPGGDRPTRFSWKWIGSPAGNEDGFGDPTSGTQYDICLYAGRHTDLDATIPTGTGWSTATGGYTYKDASRGVRGVRLRSGQRRSMILVRGSGPLLDAPHLPLSAQEGDVVIQLHDRDAGRCWGATFPLASIEKNYAGTLGQVGRRDGKFVAEVP